MNVLSRIGLWFVSLPLGVALFTLLLSLFLGALGSGTFKSIFPIFLVTMRVALPVWCLWLLFVIAVKDAEGRRIWTILLSGSLIGPVLIALWSLILQLRGVNQEKIWYGDPLLGRLGGGIAGMIFALIVGFLTTSFYVAALRVLHRRSIASCRSIRLF